MSSPLLDAHVSVFQGSTNTTPVEHVSLGTILGRIQGGTYQQHTEALRQLLASGDDKAYRAAKERSLAFTPCCAMQTRSKDVPWPQKLLNTTGLVHFDCDHLDDPQAFKALLAQHAHVAFAFISPSGQGVKMGVAASGMTDPDTYKHAWTMTLACLKSAYPDVHFNEDPHVKFLNALCYVSHDPTLFLNPDVQPYAVPPPMITPVPASRLVPTTTIPRDRRERYAQRGIANAVQMIAESVPGQQHRARCQAAYLLGGYVAGGLLTTAEAEAALMSAVEATAQDTKRAMRDITDCLTAGETKPITLDALEEDWQRWKAAHPRVPHLSYRHARAPVPVFAPTTTQEASPWH